MFQKHSTSARKNHHFIPQTKTKLLHKLKSEDNTFLIFDFSLNIFKQTHLSLLKTFSYIACIHGDFYGEINMDKQGVMVEFLYPHGQQKNFKWPRNPGRRLVLVQYMLSTISVPVTTTGCLYKISDGEFNNIVK